MEILQDCKLLNLIALGIVKKNNLKNVKVTFAKKNFKCALPNIA